MSWRARAKERDFLLDMRVYASRSEQHLLGVNVFVYRMIGHGASAGSDA
jgi:hypothetical protein